MYHIIFTQTEVQTGVTFVKKDELHQLLRSVPFPDTPEGSARVREIMAENGIDPHTFYQKMEMSSRFVDAHMDITYPGDTVEIHSHDFHEAIYCISGGMDYLIGTEQYHLTRGDILSIPTGVSHAPLIPEHLAEPYRRYVLWLSPEFIQLVSNMFHGENGRSAAQPFVLHTTGTPWEDLGESFHRCVQECTQRHFRWDAAAFGIATELSVQVARLWHGEQHSDVGKPELLDRIMSYVGDHLSEKITMADISAQFWVSQSTISQLFRREVGVSFYRYVTQRRLTESKLLIQSGIPMEQVSISVGFQDYSTFYRAFKSEYGLSPAQYRKKQ